MDNFNEIIDDTKKNINNFGSNYRVLFILIIVIIIFYLFFSLSGINSESYPLLYFIHNVLWILLVFIILLNTSSYFFNIDIINEINNFFTNKNQQDIDIEFAFEKEKEKDISLNVVDTSSNIVNKEVFHIPGNKFTYHDAKAICKAFDSEIATYEQLKNAQQNGASWCSYGWTEDQLALYPTNENDWNKLQNKSDNRYDCGLPGINGGHIKNTHIKMGANCYGIKPEKSKLEKDLELNKNNPLYAKTYKEYIFDKRTNEWKDKLGNIVIKGFNNETWFQ